MFASVWTFKDVTGKMHFRFANCKTQSQARQQHNNGIGKLPLTTHSCNSCHMASHGNQVSQSIRQWATCFLCVHKPNHCIRPGNPIKEVKIEFRCLKCLEFFLLLLQCLVFHFQISSFAGICFSAVYCYRCWLSLSLLLPLLILLVSSFEERIWKSWKSHHITSYQKWQLASNHQHPISSLLLLHLVAFLNFIFKFTCFLLLLICIKTWH